MKGTLVTARGSRKSSTPWNTLSASAAGSRCRWRDDRTRSVFRELLSSEAGQRDVHRHPPVRRSPARLAAGGAGGRPDWSPEGLAAAAGEMQSLRAALGTAPVAATSVGDVAARDRALA